MPTGRAADDDRLGLAPGAGAPQHGGVRRCAHARAAAGAPSGRGPPPPADALRGRSAAAAGTALARAARRAAAGSTLDRARMVFMGGESGRGASSTLAVSASIAQPADQGASRSRRPAAVGKREPADLGSVAWFVWLTGFLAALAGLARGLLREGRLRARSHPLGRRLARGRDARPQRALGVSRRVRLLTSDAVTTPLTSGWPSPAILLPRSAEAWPAERQCVVLQHEMAHVARGDAWRLLAWRLVAAGYWFHPLARLCERHARLAGEQACDEAVVGLGTRPSAYARHLIEIAESLRVEPQRFAGALPMVDRGQLERRLLMILDTRRPAQRGGAVALFCLAVLAALVVAVSAATPAARKAGLSHGAATASGSRGKDERLRRWAEREHQRHDPRGAVRGRERHAPGRLRSPAAPRRRPPPLRARPRAGSLRREGRRGPRAAPGQLGLDRDPQRPAVAADADHRQALERRATSGG